MQLNLTLVLCFPGLLVAQGDTKKELVPAQQLSYLERAHAIERSELLQERNIKDIQRLKILTANFGAKVGGSAEKFEAIKAAYRKGTENYYRRNFTESRKQHEECSKLIEELYQGFAANYQESLNAMLTECSLSLSDVEFTQSMEPGQTAASLSDRIQRNQFKLRSAYAQVNLAEDNLRERRFPGAIDHYRLAKLYAISVLKGLSATPEKAKELDTKYAVDLRDAMGRSTDPEKK